MHRAIVFLLFFNFLGKSYAQPNPNQLGAWYIAVLDAKFGDSSRWGFLGDVQWRNFDFGSDLDQLLIRGGIYYKPKNTPLKISIGYANVTNGTYGPPKNTKFENRIHQDLIYPMRAGKRFYFNHRLRIEERFFLNAPMRTRFRFNLFLNVPLNKPKMEKGSLYLALYNEIFINGERNIGNGKTVEIFDRNRFYSGFGYMINKNLKVQLAIMNQTTDSWKKNQLQFNVIAHL